MKMYPKTWSKKDLTMFKPFISFRNLIVIRPGEELLTPAERARKRAAELSDKLVNNKPMPAKVYYYVNFISTFEKSNLSVLL